MYFLSDKPAAIKEVQKFLHFIADRETSNIPRVAIDGIYGSETRDAVSAFQLWHGLEITGEVDRVTFDALFKEYDDIRTMNSVSDFIVTGKPFPFELGDQSDDVLLIHLLITELQKSYKDIGNVRKTTYYSSDTENAVKALQHIFMMEENGVVDALMYQRMKDEIDSINRIGEVYK